VFAGGGTTLRLMQIPNNRGRTASKEATWAGVMTDPL
jgi:hypothetical protein